MLTVVGMEPGIWPDGSGSSRALALFRRLPQHLLPLSFAAGLCRTPAGLGAAVLGWLPLTLSRGQLQRLHVLLEQRRDASAFVLQAASLSAAHQVDISKEQCCYIKLKRSWRQARFGL